MSLFCQSVKAFLTPFSFRKWQNVTHRGGEKMSGGAICCILSFRNVHEIFLKCFDYDFCVSNYSN